MARLRLGDDEDVVLARDLSELVRLLPRDVDGALPGERGVVEVQHLVVERLERSLREGDQPDRDREARQPRSRLHEMVEMLEVDLDVPPLPDPPHRGDEADCHVRLDHALCLPLTRCRWAAGRPRGGRISTGRGPRRRAFPNGPRQLRARRDAVASEVLSHQGAIRLHGVHGRRLHASELEPERAVLDTAANARPSGRAHSELRRGSPRVHYVDLRDLLILHLELDDHDVVERLLPLADPPAREPGVLPRHGGGPRHDRRSGGMSGAGRGSAAHPAIARPSPSPARRFQVRRARRLMEPRRRHSAGGALPP